MYVIHENIACVKRETRLNYLTMDRPYRTQTFGDEEAVCPTGSQRCGSDIEYGEYQFCFPGGYECPIVNIRFEIGNDTTKLQESLILENDTAEMLPLIDFALS
mmetsp:Transcript_25151/g.24613  ORF Transcript_25151/g.24613 Transcript_25151/m.24613 type:complete len:103 (+) Transcript_25151:414-722(+)